MSIEHSETIAAAVDTVWALTVDIESWPVITPTTVTTVERLDRAPLRPGSTARLKQPGQRPTIWTVTEIEPVQRFAWRAHVFGTTMTATHTLTALSPESTENTLRIDIEGPLARFVNALAGRRIRNVLAIENRSFKSAAEASTIRGPAAQAGT